ncbi:MAG: hypothetical protein FK732_12435 [Asgard group archaeon]|nr:hypothetical protein [Asgard group archaeon]
MNTRKIFLAAWGPIKTILIIWGFLLLIITFIYFIFFDPSGLLSFIQDQNPLNFNVITVVVTGLLFLFWLIVWNTLIKAFFKEDLQFMEKNGLKLAEING